MTDDTTAANTLDYFYEIARTTYNSRPLAYHNWEHVQNMLEGLMMIVHEGGLDLPLASPEGLAIVLAIAYHDAVYVPDAYPGYNESHSALLFRRDFKAGQEWNAFAPVNVDYVCELIEATKVANHIDPAYKPKSVCEAILLDLDLSSMAAGYRAFEANQIKLATEHSGRDPFDNEAARSNSAAFLVRFLSEDRASIYHTDWARKLWEDKARANINKYVYGD